MFCKNCGKPLVNNAFYCPYCGVMVATPQPTAPMVPVPDEKKGVNGLGIAGFVVSLLSLGLGIFFDIVPVIGLILSIVGLSLHNRYSSCNGLAIAGLVIGIISTVIWAILWIAVGALGAILT